MPDCKPHCPEHEERTKLLASHSVCIEVIKRGVEEQLRVAKELQKHMDGKVDMGTFKWIMSGVGAVAVLILVTLMAQFGMMTNIEADVRVMAVELKSLDNNTRR